MFDKVCIYQNKTIFLSSTKSSNMFDKPISEVMATKVITFKPEMTIDEATAVLAKNKFSGAPVVNENNDLIGMLSEKDCLRTIVDTYYNQRPSSSMKVMDYMSANVVFITEDKTIVEVAYMFVHSNFKRFPVVKNGKLTGQISRSDILKLISDVKPDLKIVPDTWKVREPQM
jgi:predicted transcriptional regulator